MASSKLGDVYLEYLKVTSSPSYGVTDRFSCRQQSLAESDEEFLRIVKDGEAQELIYYLQTHPSINLNCCDTKGLRALEIAVIEHDEAVVDALISMGATMGTFNSSHLQGAAIQAVRENEPEILLSILDAFEKAQDEKFKCLEDERDCTAWTFQNVCAPGMTPIVAAAICGNLEITRLLLLRGHFVKPPHCLRCNCITCETPDLERLSQSMARINTYKALASPVYIILTSDDPILEGLKLSSELNDLSQDLPEHQTVLLELSKQCSRFAADLLDACCDTREVQTVLMQKKGFPDPRIKYSRLHLAVQYGQKEFVTHPSCQQVVSSMWTEGLSWSRWSTAGRCTHVIKHMLLFPFLTLAYIIFPVRSVRKHMEVPLNRFIYYATSYLIFLALILSTLSCASCQDVQSPLQNMEIVVGVFVFAYFWDITINMYLLGVKECFRSWWTVYDFVLFSLFLLAEILWLAAYVVFKNEKSHYFASERNLWPWYHPYLIGEGIYAVASILAFLRLMLWYQIHARLGPLSTSLRYMVGDVFRFLLIIFIFMFAFSTGINSLYRNYKGNVHYSIDGTETVQPTDFVRLRNSFKTVFWAIFGLGMPEAADLIVAGNSTENFTVPQHVYTEFLGYSLWGVYHLLTFVILMNMLVAMLTNSFQRINDNADIEWKFARSSLWLAYLDNRSTLAAPFNLIPTALGISSAFNCIRSFFKPKSHSAFSELQKCCICNSEHEKACIKQQEEIYQSLLVHLIHRYLKCKDRKESLSAHIPAEMVERLRSDIMMDFQRSLRKNKFRKKANEGKL